MASCGDIWEKQMTTRTHLRFHNIAYKAALKFGDEVWCWSLVMKFGVEVWCWREPENGDWKQHILEFFRYLLGITKSNPQRNQSVKEKLGLQKIQCVLKIAVPLSYGTVRTFSCQYRSCPLKCAVVWLYSVVKHRLKCNTGKACNCLIQFLLTMVLSI
jgi:hypothetical protein